MTPASTYSRRAILKLGLAAALAPTLRPVAAFAGPPFPPALQLTFPQDALVTEFVDSFGFARSGGRRHQGNDLMAPKMTPVLAAADGVVTSVGEGGSAGRRLIIEHAGGFETWYLHLNNDTPGTDDGAGAWSDTLPSGIEEGVEVHAGQLISWVGDSGNAEWTGSHTHFELHHAGEAIDPYPYLVPAYADARRRAVAARNPSRARRFLP